jgi:protein-S-isoprenylcysteine O-methyltransferase Ste14
MKRHHYENLLPLAFTIISIGIFIFYYWNRVHNYIGMVFTVVGLIIWWTGKLTLGDAWAIKAKAKKLVTKGIYSKIRNPIYLGLLLTMVGWAIYIPCPFWAVASLISIPIFIIRPKNEEKVLAEKFGKKYKDYKKKTWF